MPEPDELQGQDGGAEDDATVANPESLADPAAAAAGEEGQEGAEDDAAVAAEGKTGKEVAPAEVDLSKIDLSTIPGFQEVEAKWNARSSELEKRLESSEQAALAAQDRLAVQDMDEEQAKTYVAERGLERALHRITALETDLTYERELRSVQSTIAQTASEASGVAVSAGELDPTLGWDGMMKQAFGLASERIRGAAPASKTGPVKKAPAAQTTKGPGAGTQTRIEELTGDDKTLMEALRKGEVGQAEWKAAAETTES